VTGSGVPLGHLMDHLLLHPLHLQTHGGYRTTTVSYLVWNAHFCFACLLILLNSLQVKGPILFIYMYLCTCSMSYACVPACVQDVMQLLNYVGVCQ
jgi:hypothetical protein